MTIDDDKIWLWHQTPDADFANNIEQKRVPLGSLDPPLSIF